jgi:AAT family amino acid transporter/D-serine/D-alanine/glycine transporter
MPGAPVMNWLVLAFLASVLVLLAFDEGTRVALYVGPLWFAILAVGYLVARSRA